MKQITLFLCLLISIKSISQIQNSSALSIDQIMQGDEFVGYLPTQISWSNNSQLIYFNWNPNNDILQSTYKVTINTKKIDKLSFVEIELQTNDGDFTKDYLWKVYEKNGDLFLINNSDSKITQITNTLAIESEPKFSNDERYFVYTVNNNLFKWEIANGSTTQLTDFRKESEVPKTKLSAQDQWLENDQLTYFNVLAKRKTRKDAEKHKQEQTKNKRPKTIYTGDKNMQYLSISPDLRYVVYQFSIPVNDKKTLVPDYVTKSGYTTNIFTTPKVGSPQTTYESWILDLTTGSSYQISTENIEGIFDKPKYLKEYSTNLSTYNDKYEKPREVIIDKPVFSEDGKALVNVTSQDYKDRWIMSLDLSNGILKTIDRQHDDAWIGGNGIGWFSNIMFGWIDNNNIWFKSEETGYAHLYSANVNTGKIDALTKGKFEILDVKLSRDKKTFYIISNKVSPFETHFYHMNVCGGKMNQITYLKGGYEVTISPDEKYLAIRYSNSTNPWELYLMENKPDSKMLQLTHSTTKDFNAYKWKEPEIIRFKAKDGVYVPAKLYKPTEDKKNGAAIIFVHGSGYMQNVHNWWPFYYREYMFNNLLVDNGYTVLAIDYRASAGYGRDWRTSIYRHMGGKDLDDQIDGAKYLIEQQGISKDKLGMYGGSYGGFITLMAMFKYPDTFKSGAALRSVTDWAHYQHEYTACILNTPVEDSLAYVRSSPIYYAEGLKGNLLMMHGMIDTNVHFQDIIRLSQRLIELKKENWELSAFPLEEHSFIESSSWSDEYRRIFKLFQETLNDVTSPK